MLLKVFVCLSLALHVRAQCTGLLQGDCFQTPCCQNLNCVNRLCFSSCTADGQSCTTNSNCCSGLCNGNLCTTNTPPQDPVVQSPTCVALLNNGCTIGAPVGNSTRCCDGSKCAANGAQNTCFPCIQAGSSSTCSTTSCCDGAVCSNNRCVASGTVTQAPTTQGPALDPVPTTAAPCLGLLVTGCTVDAAVGSATRCCNGSRCVQDGGTLRCFPCIQSGGSCTNSQNCCNGLACVSNRCQGSSPTQAPTQAPTTAAPTPPLDPVVTTPAPCLGLLVTGCTVDAAVGSATRCCNGSRCAQDGGTLRCFPCIQSGGSCTNSQNCCDGLACVSNRCQGSLPTQAPTTPPLDPVVNTTTAAPSCIADLALGCVVGAAAGSNNTCCSTTTFKCRNSQCLPCLSNGTACGASADCCDGLTCNSSVCTPVATTPTTAAPTPTTAAPTSCIANLATGCVEGAAAGSNTSCCSSSTFKCRNGLCLPCILNGSSCGASIDCCEGLSCESAVCVAASASVTTQAPVTAPLDPTNCLSPPATGCSDAVTSLRCCAGSFCNTAQACIACLNETSTTTCVASGDDSRRCCDGLTCNSGSCQVPTAATTPSISTTATACSPFGAPCSASQPCCPGGFTCVNNACDLDIVGRLDGK